MSDAQLIAAAAWQVYRSGQGGQEPRQDMVQNGWLALLEAQAKGQVPPPGKHRTAYIRVRAEGGIRDACRVARRQSPDLAMLDEQQLTSDAPTPEDAAHLRLQLQRFNTDPRATPRQRLALQLLVSGHSTEEMAAAMGVSWSAVSKLLASVACLMAQRRRERVQKGGTPVTR